MGRLNDFGYGILSNRDVKTIESSLDLLIQNFRGVNNINLLEIGLCDKRTIRSIKQFLDRRDVSCNYWAIDKKQIRQPFDGCNIIAGDSAESFMLVPKELHWVFIDGCHCVNHIMLDFLHYSDRVVHNGFVIFHDTSPIGQKKFDYQGHGPKDCHEFGTATLAAWEKLHILERTDLRLIENVYDPTLNWGGVAIFQKD